MKVIPGRQQTMRRRIIPGVVNQSNVIAIPETENAHNALQTMGRYDINVVPVTDGDGHLVGIVSEHDLIHHILARDAGSDVTPLCEIMTKSPEALRANDDALDAMELMVNRHIHDLPVVSQDNRIIAMVSTHDLLAASLKDLNSNLNRAHDKAFAPEDE